MIGRWLAAVPTPGVAIGLVAIMASLYAVDQSLAHLETVEVNAQARDLYNEGQALLARGHAASAADRFERAYSLNRSNNDFELALAGAQLAAGKTLLAEATISDILARNPNGGQANLLMARLRLRQDRFDDAVSYYHRSIYGSWAAQDEERKRNAVRIELTQQLAQRRKNRQLLSELLLLDAQAQDDPDLALQVAHWYLIAGSPQRAESTYRSLLKHSGQNAAAYEGLGQAELQRGDYRAAHGSFMQALKYSPGDSQAASRIELAGRLAQLDPTSRRLGSAEKLRRSADLLALAAESITTCLGAQAPHERLEGLLRQAAEFQDEKFKGPPSNEAAEARLELAGELWKSRPEGCEAKLGTDHPLPILISKIEGQ